MPAKYIYGTLIVYVLMAGIVVVMHPSSSEVEIVTDGLLWPRSILGFVWEHMAKMFGRIFV